MREVLEKITALASRHGRPFEILIVDDEQWVREVLQDFCALTPAFKIDTAACGREALARVKAKKYDLITLDLIMPEMSGLDTLNAIKTHSPKIPVILITGNATEKLIQQAGVAGACRVLHKPVGLDQFVAEVGSTLAKQVPGE